MTRPAAAYWINKLQLTQHIEGGSYRRTYAADLLLLQDQLPAMHRLAADELWHFYYGDPLIVYEIDSNGELTEHVLGNNPGNSESFQCVIKAGSWFGSKIKTGGDYSLTGCTVAPGFDFEDFELGNRDQLIQTYPQHAAIIKMLTRGYVVCAFG